MSRSRIVTLAAAVGIGAVLAASWYRMSPRAQTGPAVRSEHWPELGLDPHEVVFENGFRIVLIEDHRVPRVAASLQYRFGALSERNGEHGSAYFLEHAMHQGTTTVGVKDRDVDRKLLRAIYDTEQELLAERNAHRNDVRERNVFYDEGDWPITGKEQRLRQKLYELEDEQSKNRIFWEEYNWYRRSGGIMRHGDPVPANTGNELLRIEVDLPKERMELFLRLDWLEPIEPTMLVRYRIPGVGHPDRPVFDVIARLLRGSDGPPAASAQGAARGVEWQANASSSGSQNTLTMQARAGRDEDLGALERTALGEVERLRREPVDEVSLARVRRAFRLDWELLRSDRGALATQFGSFAIAGDWRTLRTHYQRRATATAEEVRRVAERYLVPWNRVIATTRRNPQPRAEGNTTSARPVVGRTVEGTR